MSERIRELFKDLPSFESNGRRLRLGDHPSDDFRYLRLFWEVAAVPFGREWPPYYKGCNNTAYYDETRLVVDWDSDRQTYRDFFGRPGRSSVRPSNYQYFFLAGLTVPYLPHLRGRFSHVPSGGVFGHASPMIHLPINIHWSTCAILNSEAFVKLLHLLMARGIEGGKTLKYEVVYVRSVPIPEGDQVTTEALAQGAKACYEIARGLSASNETSHVFHLPALLQVSGPTLADQIASWNSHLAETDRQLAEHQREIDDIAFRLYGIDDEDRALLEGSEARSSSYAEGESEPSEEDEP